MNITIPHIPLPFEVPALIHPFFVHFAIAIPIIVFLIEIINLFSKRKIVGGISFFLLILTSIILFGAYLTGIKDASLAKDLISGSVKEVLEAHKQYGIYLVYLSLIVLFFKLISAIVNKIQVKILYLFLLIGFIGVTIVTGKKGGELVYKYGINIKSSNTSIKKVNQTTKNKKEANIIPITTSNRDLNNTKKMEKNTTSKKVEQNHTTQTKDHNNSINENNTTNIRSNNQQTTKNNITPISSHQEDNQTNKNNISNSPAMEKNETTEKNITTASIKKEEVNTTNEINKTKDINSSQSLPVANNNH